MPLDLYKSADEINTYLSDIENKLVELHIAAFKIRFDSKSVSIGLRRIDDRWRLVYACDPVGSNIELVWKPISDASIRTRLDLVPLLDEFVKEALLEADEIHLRARDAVARLVRINVRLGEYHMARASADAIEENP